MASSKPFVKWAGGKRQLLSVLDQYFPTKITHFVEPFVGAGAVFFHLRNTRNILKSTINDYNHELMNVYAQLKDHYIEVAEHLERAETLYNSFEDLSKKEEIYYGIRSKEYRPTAMGAARTIMLNKLCFNGLYRVNKSGGFNVPFGKKSAASFGTLKELEEVHLSLQRTNILSIDFREVPKCIPNTPETFYYFDPPYHPIKEDSFVNYTSSGFTGKDQEDLRDLIKELYDRGVPFVLSNSACEFIRNLYQDFCTIHTVSAKRSINSDKDGRSGTNEFIIIPK